MRYTKECALLLLTIHHQLVQRIFDSGYVSVDETVVKLIDRDRRHKAQTSYLWVFMAPTADAIVFEFSLTRGAENASGFFPLNWQGQLKRTDIMFTRASRKNVLAWFCLDAGRISIAAQPMRSGASLGSLRLRSCMKSANSLPVSARRMSAGTLMRSAVTKDTPNARRLQASEGALSSI